MAKKKTTLGKVGAAVTDAAATVAEAAKEHVIQPVGKALGLTGKKAKKPAPKSPLGAKRAPKTPAAKTMTKGVAKTAAKPRVKPGTPKGPSDKGGGR